MYRAKRIDNGEMIEGYYCYDEDDGHNIYEKGFLNEINPDTLEIKIGDNWFSPEYVESIFKKLGEFGLKRLMKE